MCLASRGVWAVWFFHADVIVSHRLWVLIYCPHICVLHFSLSEHISYPCEKIRWFFSSDHCLYSKLIFYGYAMDLWPWEASPRSDLVIFHLSFAHSYSALPVSFFPQRSLLDMHLHGFVYHAMLLTVSIQLWTCSLGKFHNLFFQSSVPQISELFLNSEMYC